MPRPDSLLGNYREKTRKRLITDSRRVKFKEHFSFSEMGSECARKVMYGVLSFTKRPYTIENISTFNAGDVYHQMIQGGWQDTYQLDGVEAVFNEPMLKNHIWQRAEELGATVELIEFKPEGALDMLTGEQKVVRYLQYELECEDNDGKIRVKLRGRPDGFLVGDAGADGWWEPDEWTLLEVKSTSDWAISQAKKSVSWYVSHIVQAQLSMHLFDVPECLILQIGRGKCFMLGDDYQKAYKHSAHGHPEHQWQRVQYNPEIVASILRRAAIWERKRRELRLLIETHGPDSNEVYEAMPWMNKKDKDTEVVTRTQFGCEGKGDWVFNRCPFNTKSTYDTFSDAQCPGGC